MTEIQTHKQVATTATNHGTTKREREREREKEREGLCVWRGGRGEGEREG